MKRERIKEKRINQCDSFLFYFPICNISVVKKVQTKHNELKNKGLSYK